MVGFFADGICVKYEFLLISIGRCWHSRLGYWLHWSSRFLFVVYDKTITWIFFYKSRLVIICLIFSLSRLASFLSDTRWCHFDSWLIETTCPINRMFIKSHFVCFASIIRPSPLFFRLLSNAFSDFGSVGRKRKKKTKIKLEKESGATRPGTSA